MKIRYLQKSCFALCLLVFTSLLLMSYFNYRGMNIFWYSVAFLVCWPIGGYIVGYFALQDNLFKDEKYSKEDKKLLLFSSLMGMAAVFMVFVFGDWTEV